MHRNPNPKSKMIKSTKTESSYWTFWQNLCSTELYQNEKLSHNLVNKILFSKRLLVDHVESLELCLALLSPIQPAEVFTFRNTSLVVASTILQKFITPRSLKFTMVPFSFFTSGFCCFYLVKKVSDVRLKFIEREMEKLVEAIDNFGNCIKRNIMYFNEILVMKPQELIESRQIERAWDCITSIKEVIDILYDSTRKLEENYKLSTKFCEFYYPMEELRESDYFKRNVTDFSPKNIKDFYNIFAYVQSQFLLRLALTVSQDSTISFIRQDVSEIQCLIQQHINEEDEHFMNLSLQLKSKQQFEAAMLHHQQTHQIKSGPVAVLKDSSLKLSSCIIAVAEECQKLDIVLQKINEKNDSDDSDLKSPKEDGNNLLQVANSMRGIENSLSICCEDFHRLMLVYNKFLNSKLGIKETSKENSMKLEESIDHEVNEELNENKVEDVEKKDDFYAYVHDEKADDENLKRSTDREFSDFELINLEEKVTKGRFKPVLKQLKTKINPIRQEMLDKERKVLESKGIDLDKLLEVENKHSKMLEPGDGLCDSDSEGSTDEVEREAIKIRKDRYEEMRNFLVQKEAVNIFGNIKLPEDSLVSEDILE